MRRVVNFLLVFALLCSGLLLPTAQALYAEADTPQDTPTPLVGSGVTSYTLTEPKVFWYTGVPQCPPTVAAASTDQTAGQYTETIKRVAAYGSTVRTLYAESRNCNQGQVLSNIVADTDFLYWLTGQGLFKLSTNANPGDAPQLMNALVSGYGEVADGGDRVFTIHNTGGNNYAVSYVLKSNNQKVPLATYGASASNLHWDGQYLYYMVSGNLVRLTPSVDSGVTIVKGASGYYPEGRRLLFCSINPFHCFFSNNVYVAKGRQVFVYNNDNNTLGSTPVYTSVDTGATVFELLTDFSKLFLFERRPIPCSPDPCFQSYNYVLNRTPRGGGAVDALYTFGPTLFTGPSNLRANSDYLFWHENDTVQRLAKDATALPQVNLRVTGMEITQGIQNLSNGVMLVKGRRTFVRLYVKSDGAAVAGVTAQLSAPSLESGPLAPINSVGTKITVRGAPNRNDLDQSFLFELPWSWTQQNNLTLRAILNPYKVPLEPNYGDNTGSASISFKPSPTLSAEFYRLNYTLGGTTYRPRISADVLKTYSWIMRAYPIGGAIGTNFKPRLWDVDGGTWLGSYVNRTHPDCTKSKIGSSDLNLCASYYTNGWLKYYRDHGWVPNTNDFYYGMISDGSGNFPRGQALYSKTSVGPAGTPCSPFNLGCGWDTDGSYADWYAGHEMGHSLGRAHPSASAALCGNSASDPSYPYPNGQIGPNDGSMEGFDVGDPSFGIARRVYPGTSWYDVMSYCSNQWISDYTYTGMYNFMIAHPSVVVAAASATQVNGDFLSIAGAIDTATNTGGFSLVRRLSTVVSPTTPTPGNYSVRLLDGQDTVLAETAFTPNPAEDSPLSGFDLVINFVAGARAIQLVNTSDKTILATQTISANPPTISDVALQGAPNPVSGTVTLGWTASDPDGDPLTFDIFYSRDNGATFQPVQMNATGSSTQIDTAVLGGSGTAILQVVASDGVNTAEAASAPFVMANKAPEPYILLPEDNLHIHYGQLVNFNAMAFDAQDGLVAEGGFVWKNASGDTLGNGPMISLTDLPVGANVITLVATNSVGESATTTVTVIVDDDLNLPGPTLSAGPTPVGWQIAADVTTAQNAVVSINNAGGDKLTWNAASDQPWLTLDVITGTINAGDDPMNLTLTADPAGLEANQTHVAHVTITTPGLDPVQSIVIPVSLSIGDVWNQPAKSAPEGEQKLYLPLVTR
ncbi:MAG: hypothetical protein R3C14_10570 [Caldilineaceae bacterium]